MTTKILKEKIHSLIDNSSDETLQSVYQLLQATDYTDAFKNTLNEEFEAYQKDGAVVTSNEMGILIKDVLSKGK
jgi:predicted house-cleaning noncanonical NTP pyrophosphatase (MazG superfamily)